MAYKDHNRALEYWRQYNAKRRKPQEKHAREIAKERGETHYFTGEPCKHGHVAKRHVNNRACSECVRIKQEKMRKTHPDKIKQKKRESYARNKEHHLAQKKKYRQANKGKITALNTARKAVVRQRTPAWLTQIDRERIGNEYKLAAFLTKFTGESWHVDHVLPLQGKLVSGLHVPSNLKAVRGSDNISKKNKYEVAHA